ncbi:hypothetical protein [Microvirga antarctica]|uniref:hypothetical protein n=1 Tax=Microvirga antarctica TaxID=2819233 RepID=UPI001B309DC6|nr:hypothetical protein [Microvirga antarctica]
MIGSITLTARNIHARTRTPHLAVACLAAILAPLVVLGNISLLASATVLMLRVVFTVMNGALFILSRRTGEPQGSFEVWPIVPLMGGIVCLALIVVRVSTGD